MVSLDQIIENSNLMDQLTVLAKKNYEFSHAENPVGEFDFVAWQDIMLAEDLFMQGSLIYLDSDNQRIIAYSFMHYSDARDTLELGWCGVLDPSYIGIIPDLIARQIHFAKELG